MFYRTAFDFTFLDLSRAPLNNIAPLRFSVSIDGVIETGDKPAHEERPILFRQSQHLGYLFTSNAQVVRISNNPAVVKSRILSSWDEGD